MAKDFADLANRHLEQAGFNVRIDHRSYADQNHGLQATSHEGPSVTALRRQYEREQQKPCDERNHEIVLPALAKQNDAIKLFNLELGNLLRLKNSSKQCSTKQKKQLLIAS